MVPDAALGGPAVAGGGGMFLTQFLQHCATGTNAITGTTGTRLDLITFHAKGGVTVEGDHVQMNLGGQLRAHRTGFNAVAAFPQFQQTPIYITEADPEACAACPASAIPGAAYRTSPAYGAYEIAMMKHTLELEAALGIKLGGLVTWAFTFPGTPYFAGYRALATNGIHLPVLGAFELLGRLAGDRLPLTSSGALDTTDIVANSVRGEPEIDGMATLNGPAVQVLLWNYHDDLVPVPATPVRLTVQLPAGFGPRARIAHLRVDESHGDAYTVWVSQGMPPNPSSGQVAALQRAMAPAPLAPDRTVVVASDGSVAVDFALPRFGVSLVTLVPAAGDDGEPGGGCGCLVAERAGDPGDFALRLAASALVVGALIRRRRHLH